MSKVFDLVTIGDSSIDIFMKIDGHNVMEESDHDMPKICFYHGSKIPVDHCESTIAGNALNVAVGATTLGLDTAIYSEVGDDQKTVTIYKELKDHGVNTKYINVNKGTETDVHSVIVYKGERTIFSYHGKRNYSVDNIPQSKWIYYTSMGKGFENFQKDLIDYVKETKTGLAFNPGTIQMLIGIESLKNILEVTDILFVNKEEAQKLAETDSDDLRTLHKKLQSLGAKLSVITDGENGATASNSNEFEEHKIYSDSRPLVDMTGAGDSFSSGFISAIIYGKTLKESLSWGIVNSGNVVKEVGSIRGLTNKRDIERIVKTLI